MLTLIFCWLTAVHAAQKRALLLGGGGEPKGPSTSFDESLAPMAGMLREARYETAVAFDGGHAATDRILADEFKAAGPFSAEGARSRLDQLERDIRAGQVTQALIVVDSHGESTRAEGVVHRVEMDGDAGAFDLGELRRVQATARRYGVKLAIVDHSCYSGQTLALADPDTCVITAGSAETVSYVDFANTLFAEFKPGESLEAAFLRARRKSTGPAWPQIGTPAGTKARDTLARLHDEVTAYPADLATRDAASGGGRLCLTSAVKQLDVLRGVLAGAARLDRATVRDLARLNHEYQDLRTTKAAEVVANNAILTLPSGFKVSHRALVTLDEILRRANLMARGGADSELRDVVKHERELRAFRTELMARLPKFRDEVRAYSARGLTDPATTGSPDRGLEALGLELAATERKVYDAIYAEARTKGANACRDFKF